MAKDAQGHGSMGRGGGPAGVHDYQVNRVPMRPGTQSDYAAHQSGVAAVPHADAVIHSAATDAQVALMKQYPLVPPSTQHSAPDVRLASWKRTAGIPGR